MKRVITIGPNPHSKGGIASVEKLIMEHFPQNIGNYFVNTYSEGNLLVKILVFLWSLVKLNLIIMNHRNKVKIVHIHFSSKGSLVRKAIIAINLMLCKKPYILHAHTSEFHLFYNRLPKLVQKLIKIIFNKCKYLIVLSKYWREYFISNLNLPKNKIKILPNPVKISSLKQKDKNNGKINIFFAGRICKPKGAFDLIKAIKSLPENIVERLQVEIAGDGEIEKARNMVEELELYEYVKIYSWLSEAERNQKFLNADIFILPSYNEGLPMALLEAMSYGLAIITTPVGGIPEVIINNENGILVHPGNLKEISDAIRQLILDRNKIYYLGANARKTVEKFDINIYIEKLIKEIYEFKF
ncbi:Glycosyltransferase involved in cell wall bisynthesis [Carboxydocella sporoproducens DSM 16521]|uniref:Glycosyltransferase involved in cell wall bisynthesis n=2 Tax=Carboxydocella TaxID=178898 RepID=A0A1T4L6U6_9FIRM|nr:MULTISPECIES: glycosyltransferase family 4 protein [Carboxydocella]AVX19942.1 Glycosyltransferase involved in cell wall bisynthesis [Carboxydocella thermautotrophica]SJZ50270.1 Glycosyltransferase involved in cell wall bisynthesis [Carboxydocella sporoproducens DSM 16521]